MEILAIVIGGIVAIALLEEGRKVATRYFEHRRVLAIEEHKTRRIEALAKLDEPARERLLATMPDWLDKNDPDDVEAWKKARAETNLLEDKHHDRS